MSLDWLYGIVTWIILRIHDGLSYVFDPDSGAAWGLSIVLLTILVRVVLFPLFVKQIHSMRKMQELQPQIKELQKKYKNDKQKLREEQMKLFQESGANPLGGCLPLIAQAPVFYALFHVLRTIADMKPTSYGLTPSVVNSAAHAKIFGAPIAAHFLSNPADLARLDATPWVVKTVALCMVIAMAATTFITQRQMMIRNARQAGADNPFAQQQKIMLYVLPPVFAVFGLGFPIGVLVYWVTTNAWTMGQQFFVIRRMPPVGGGPGQAGQQQGEATGGGPGGGGLLARRKRPTPPPPVPKQKVIRQQPTRRPRSKRSGGRKR